ncbi:carbohydrate ABC transporter permease [Allonocardiopsis opalescens]|uniref:Arabinogalactan oligomer/maltooligosaccharide transport system permease protein n=1 Tax=Allonocardiopsis opalescens TaxID=1144618 RepID=A0A2T0Q275_9ACTN|nr:sugar ABC transporter permease [Allonocardiopsis opalescens]PRX97810.1 arabinogalactan oligomer/maltooligosaccharide transport system permease protein [Allonocardiopsis opalescens]
MAAASPAAARRRTPAAGRVSGGRAPRRERNGPLARLWRTHWYAWAMIAPVVIVLAVLIGIPLSRGLYLSFTNANESNVGRTIGMNEIPATYEFVGADNFLAILSGELGSFWPRLTWTLVWTVACTALHYGIGLGLAVALNRRLRFRAVYRMLLVLPWAVPPFVSIFIWRYLYNNDFGVFNAMLRTAGLPTVGWLNDALTAKIAVIAVNVWLGVPFMMLALLGGLQAIPKELYEASRVDGASPWQQFRYITIPGLRQISSTIVLLGTIWSFNMFPVIYLVTEGGPGDSSELLVTYAFRLAFEGIRNYSASSAYGLLILVLLIVLAVVYQRALRRGGEAW